MSNKITLNEIVQRNKLLRSEFSKLEPILDGICLLMQVSRGLPLAPILDLEELQCVEEKLEYIKFLAAKKEAV